MDQGASFINSLTKQTNSRRYSIVSETPADTLPSDWVTWQDGRDFEMVESGKDVYGTLQPYCGPTGDQVGTIRRKVTRFDFVETNTFQMIVTAVILVNVSTITLELSQPKESKGQSNLAEVDQLILGFYILELFFRIGHWSLWGFLWHPTEWYWNWVDTVVVVVGIFRRWILPLIAQTEVDHTAWAVAAGVARGLRIFKLVRALKQATLIWTASAWFQWTVAGVITLNAIVMGIETDRPSPIFGWMNQAMLVFFLFEICARIKLDGCRKFFLDPADLAWNLLDFVIVLCGVVDIWVAHLIELVTGNSKSTGFGKLMMLARMMRLARVIRLLKLVKSVKPLYVLAMGVGQAMQSIFWVLVLTMVTLYAFAILATRMVGHGLLIKDTDNVPEETQELFSTICDSMFTLFSVMNGNNWTELEPLLTAVPVTKPVFVVFTICSSWALLSVMTGVVSDHMMTVREAQAHKDEEAQEQKRQEFQRWLRGVFTLADKEGDGMLAREEYVTLLQSHYHMGRIQQVANVSANDLIMMFDWLDAECTGKIRFVDFLRGFDMLNEPSTGKSLLKIGHTARSHCTALARALAELRSDADRLHSQGEAVHKAFVQQLRDTLKARKKLDEERVRTDNALMEVSNAREALAAAREAASGWRGSDAANDALELRQAVANRHRS